MTEFAGALPGPLAKVRALRIHRARAAGRARTGKNATVDGFQLMLSPGVAAPIVAGGLHPDSFLGRHAEIRPNERVLVTVAGSGLLPLHAARAGAQVTVFGDRDDALAMERSFRLAEYEPPTVLADLGEQTFSAILLGDGASPEVRTLTPRLERGGRLLVAVADRDGADVRTALTDAGLRWTTHVLRRDGVFGTMRVLSAWMPKGNDTPGYVPGGQALAGAGWVLRDR